MQFAGLLAASFALAAFGQSAWVSFFGIGAAAFGYALFWRAMLLLPRRRDRFLLSTGWFAAVQAVQLSWLTSTDYMGPLILVVYLFLIAAIGVQFGILSLIFDEREISLRRCLAAAGCWVFMEWIRLLPFTGFTWNPVGLSLADHPLSIQFASLFGVYGLSFWVIFVNALALWAFPFWRRGAVWAAAAIFPYLFGWAYQSWIEWTALPVQPYSAALVQTAILPEEKDIVSHRSSSFVPPLNQWERIWENLRSNNPVDLIVLPEAAVSLSAYRPFYPIDLLRDVWADRFGKEALSDLPELKTPLAIEDKRGWRATNAYIAQAMANHFHAHLIAGFDHQDGEKKYNAAFLFSPDGEEPQRYEKRILVPVGEYVPFPNIRWLAAFLAEQFGIGDSFDIGSEAKIFRSSVPIGVSVCLEETYSGLIRDLRRKGADLFVNISNDVWFPRSRLPEQHFQHGRIRAAENGVYAFRACNTGITGAVDCFGRVIAYLPPSEQDRGVLYLNLPLKSFQTLYTWWGDWAILSLSAFFILFGFRKKKLPLNGSLR
jgi:apolipoprotein N-acyltransferase